MRAVPVIISFLTLFDNPLVVRVDGPLYKSAGRLKWDQFNNFDDVTKEVGENFITIIFACIWISVTKVTPDGRSADTTTSSPAGESTPSVKTTTRGGGGELMTNIDEHETLVFTNIPVPPQSLCFLRELTLLYVLTYLLN
ncbi:hypothetical protein P879_10880 [Paragonimus westermani]|uniref:Uncharacterized protein n=1 Tax=Paragonimus westermani TaxID=34504 RepID=A0A8T0D6F5_9TREM|nr:hypothetical protein P879_10880 [Paragonimus westermani]